MPGSLGELWCGPMAGQWDFLQELLKASCVQAPCWALWIHAMEPPSTSSASSFPSSLPAQGLNIDGPLPVTGQLWSWCWPVLHGALGLLISAVWAWLYPGLSSVSVG